MSEPDAIAGDVEEVIPGLWRWSVHDDRIGAESHAHAVTTGAGTVLIDPLPLEPEALRRLEPVAAICLTAACHQRSAWRYRKALGAKVHAPAGSRAMEEEPDARYEPDADLPGGLQAVHTPGPEAVHFALWKRRPPGVLFVGDLLMREGHGALAFIPSEYHEDPEATRESVRRLLDIPFDVLCMAHGAPVMDRPYDALRELLDR